MRVATFLRDSKARTVTTEVLRHSRAEQTPHVVLADTVLYPEGGGQPRDFGTVQGIEVTGLRKVDDGYLHTLASSVEEERVEVALDWPRRWDHMQQHTGQHLLSAIAQERWGLVTTSFHLGAESSDIELDRPDLSLELLREIEAAVAREIEAARPIEARWVEPDELPESVRTRGLPSDHRGSVRLVEIDGLDCTTCGGTHTSSTSEIGGLALLGAEAMRGGSRVTFVAGDRWRRRLARHESLLAGLRSQLGCRDEEIEETIGRRLDELSSLQRTLRHETEQLARFAAARLSEQTGPFAEAHFEGRDGAFLRTVAHELEPASERRLVLLTAEKEKDLYFLLVGPSTDERIATLGPRVAEILDGRGGGRGGSYQGKGRALCRRVEAIELLRSG